MQSPDSVESSKMRNSSSNSKLHTPCRQIGLRRKKSKTSDTPIKENKSPVVKTDATVSENGHTPTTPTFVSISDHSISVDENQTKENCRSQKAIEDKKLTCAVVINSGNSQDVGIKENKSPEVKTDATLLENENTPTTPTFVSISDHSISVDENQTKENCGSQKAIEDKKLTPAVVINSGNSQDVRKEIEAVKRRIKEKEEKIAALRLAKLYRKKHDTNTLSELTERWREGCQSALQELLSSSAAHGYQVNMTQLISQLGIPFHLIRYNPDLEDFE